VAMISVKSKYGSCRGSCTGFINDKQSKKNYKLLKKVRRFILFGFFSLFIYECYYYNTFM
jgi:hypothetical protein